MNKKLTALILVLVLTLSLAACGAEEAPAETTAAPAATETIIIEPLGLLEWNMNATTWSSPNGATVNLTAVPLGYSEGQTASFLIRLEGDEVANVPCQWNGTAYTAAAELNAADALCYYVLMDDGNGNIAEVPVNIPSAPTDETLINMASSLVSYCDITVTGSETADSKLTFTEGSANIQQPVITVAEGGGIICSSARLVLTHNGTDTAEQQLTIPAADENGLTKLDLSGVSFPVPEGIEDDHQLSVRLEVTFSNGHTALSYGGTWYALDGDLLLAVG